jgi:hypothetical protein
LDHTQTHTQERKRATADVGWLAGSLGYTIFACVYKSLYGGGGGGMNDSLFSPTLLGFLFLFFFCLREAMDGWMRKEGEI